MGIISPRIQPLLLNAKTSARLVGVSYQLWGKLHAQGKVPPPIVIGKRPMWRRADLEAWIENVDPVSEEGTPCRDV